MDGCITNDGDAFLYGARTVYKDLCISGKVIKTRSIQFLQSCGTQEIETIMSHIIYQKGDFKEHKDKVIT